LQAFDTPGKSGGRAALRIIHHRAQAVESPVGMLELENKLITQEAADQGRHIGLGLVIVFAVPG
jgi:hypothetical protein